MITATKLMAISSRRTRPARARGENLRFTRRSVKGSREKLNSAVQEKAAGLRLSRAPSLPRRLALFPAEHLTRHLHAKLRH